MKYSFKRVLKNLRNVSVLLGVLGAPLVQAQYLGLNLRGDVGMKSGSQPGPGYYLTLPLFYEASYSSLRGPNGVALPGQANLKLNLFATAVAATTKVKILGANYGFQVVPMVINQRLSLPLLNAGGAGTYGFGDMYIQPLNLGWHTKRADFLAAYGLFAPTGAARNTLDMWAHEIVAGTTIYADAAKKYHVSGTLFYDINQRKRSTDVKVGNYVTIEGGAGRAFLKGAANIGVAYIMQWKVTNDTGSDVTNLLPHTKNKAYGVGPEINIPCFAKGTLIGLLGFRCTFELGNSTNFQGNNLVASFTLAKLRM